MIFYWYATIRGGIYIVRARMSLEMCQSHINTLGKLHLEKNRCRVWLTSTVRPMGFEPVPRWFNSEFLIKILHLRTEGAGSIRNVHQCLAQCQACRNTVTKEQLQRFSNWADLQRHQGA